MDRSTAISALALFTAAIAVGCGGAHHGASTSGPFATVTDLGNIDTFNDQRQINDNGLMVGSLAGSGGGSQPDTWQVGGQPTILPASGLNSIAFATSINDAGIAIGGGGGACGGTPVFWQNGVMTRMQTGSGFTAPFPVEINASSQIIGQSNVPCGSGDSFPGDEQGIYWPTPSSVPQALGPSGFIPLSENDSGAVVGVLPNSSGIEYYRANLSNPANAVDLGVGGPDPNGAQAGYIVINNSGTIALASGTNLNLILIGSDGTQTQVGSGDVPMAINALGDVVGITTQDRAFVYAPAIGLVDMNQYVKPSAGFTLTEGLAINAKGQVLAFGTAADKSTHSLLVQLPPGTF